MSEPLDLDAIKARANAATPGPWDAYRPREMYRLYEVCSTTPSGMEEVLAEVSGYNASNDAEFITHARTDIHDLLDEVDWLTRLLGSHTDGHRCTCTMTRPGNHLGPAEWEQDPWCPTHPNADYIRAERDALAEQVEAVRALHERIEDDGTACDCCDEPSVASCAADGERWPCATIRTLGGES